MLEASRAPAGPRLIRPSQGWVSVDLSAVWRRRDLLYFLALRDLKVRYKQTWLGVLWVILQPIMFMAVFSVVFGVLAKMPSDGVAYPVYYFCALVPWQLVSGSFAEAGISLIANQNLLIKVYFPRLILPLSAVIGRMADFVICLGVLIGLLICYRVPFSVTMLALPIFMVLALVLGLGIGLWLAALNVRYRDVRLITPFATQLWFFLSPIAYSATLIPEQWRFLYAVNPMVGIVDGFRWALLGKGNGFDTSLVTSLVLSGIILVTGVFYFRYTEREIADVV